MNSKEKYVYFCREEPIPVFSQPWWLDIVCGKDNWSVILVERENGIIASFPYYLFFGRFGMKKIGMPMLTQKMGPYIKYPKGQKYEAKLAYEKSIVNDIVSQLPSVDHINVQFDTSVTNWLPWFWCGFEQTTRYSYRIPYQENFQNIVNEFSKKNRQLYRRGNDSIKIVHDLSVSDFYKTCCKTFERQGILVPYSLELLSKIFFACKQRGCGMPFFAIDDDKNIHSVSFEIWDDTTMYSLIGGGDPKLRNNGEKNLIFFNAIRLAMEKKIDFDFEGSMIEPIENFYRAFGAIQYPYFRIYKSNSRKYKFLRSLKNTIDAICG